MGGHIDPNEGLPLGVTRKDVEISRLRAALTRILAIRYKTIGERAAIDEAQRIAKEALR